MKVTSERRSKLYNVYSLQYEKLLGVSWEWKPDEKKRALQIFTRFSEINGIRDEALFEQVLSRFKNYVENEAKDWIGWQAANRFNYLGFLDNRDKMAIFIASLNKENTKFVGSQSNEDWDF